MSEPSVPTTIRESPLGCHTRSIPPLQRNEPRSDSVWSAIEITFIDVDGSGASELSPYPTAMCLPSGDHAGDPLRNSFPFFDTNLRSFEPSEFAMNTLVSFSLGS